MQRIAPTGRFRADGQPTVVFIHGLGTDSLASFYFTLAAPVCAAGIEVIAYDLRGHGRSERPASGYRLSDFVADLLALLDTLDVCHPVHLVGNSYGGTVAFTFALGHPQRVASVVMIESEPASEQWAHKMSTALGRAVGQLGRPEALRWIEEHYGARASRLARAAGRRLRTTTMARDIPGGPVATEEEIRSIGCPVMAILGSESHVDAAVLESLVPRCRIAIVAGHEHSVLVEAPHAVRDLLLSWIAEHDLSHAFSGRGRRA